MTDNKEVRTLEHYVAYLDFMGTKEIVYKDTDDKYLKEINDIYNSAVNFVNKINLFDDKKTFIKIFSDNILIAEEITENPKLNRDNLEKICSYCCAIQHFALKKGHLVRGAILKDKFFYNEIFVYGKALLNAVKIEEKCAFYPRIVAKQDIFKNASSYFSQYQEDGYFFLNMFMYSQDLDTAIYRNKLLDNLKLNKSNERAVQNIIWVIIKYNSFFSYMNKEIKRYPSFEPINDKEIKDILD